MTSPALQDAVKTHTDFLARTQEQFLRFFPLLRLIASGKPVSPGELATVSHRSPEEIQALMQSSDVEVDAEGEVVGWGPTLRPTPHQFYLGERCSTHGVRPMRSHFQRCWVAPPASSPRAR